MKVEKVEETQKQYPKLNEINKKEKKIKIGSLTALLISLNTKMSMAQGKKIDKNTIGLQIIPGDAPQELKIAYNYSKYTRIGYIIMLVITLISSIFVKAKWKNYDTKQKKRAKIILCILIILTLALVVITLILKSKKM